MGGHGGRVERERERERERVLETKITQGGKKIVRNIMGVLLKIPVQPRILEL